MKKRSMLYVVSLSLAALIALSGCQGQQKENPESAQKTPTAQAEQKKTNDTNDKNSSSDKSAQKVSLSDWDGEWNDLTAYFNDPELSASFEKVAARDGGTAESQKEQLLKKRHCDFGALKVSGNTVTFYDKPVDKGGKEVSHATYEFERSVKVKHGSHDLEWDIFTTKDSGATYPVILMMPIHGEESLTHFHMRYGSDADKLLTEEKWYPALIKTTSTIDQIKGEIEE